MAHYLALGIGAGFLGWFMPGDIHHPFQFSTPVSLFCRQPLRQPRASQPAPGAVGTPKLGQVWPSWLQVWLHHPCLSFMYHRGKSPPCTSFTFQSSSFRHGLAQRFILSSAFFHLLEGQNLTKPLWVPFSASQKCCNAALQQVRSCLGVVLLLSI